MAPTLKYYCPCTTVSLPPPPNLASSSYSFHEIHNLFFCEECDAIRCNRCVSVEVSGYYCPNCLFEVPSASVRGEKNRCARNCFLCPNCRNTLSVVPSDPPEYDDPRMSANVLGEPPFFLYCSHCRWDSVEVGITFEKPTSLASQLQKFEDSAPDSLEFERLKEHFEPFLRASSVPSSSSHIRIASSHHVHTNPITAAASSALARDVPGVSKYNPLTRSRAGKDKASTKDEMPEYKSRMEIAIAGGMGSGSGDGDVDFLRHLESISEVGTLEQRWMNSWTSSLLSSDLKPLRIPLHSKKSKRCPTCRHILIKPEQKPQSVRYKIKLVAANYMPSVTVSLPNLNNPPPLPSKRPIKTTGPSEEDRSSAASGAMIAGKTYPFHLSFTNPMYDPIQVRINVQRAPLPPSSATSPIDAPTTVTEKRRPPFAVSLPTSTFPVAAFAEAWEYDDEDDDDMFEDEFAELDDHIRKTTGRISGKSRTVGILEKKTNMTLVGGEVVIGKEARGDVKFNMMVTFTYRSDETGLDDQEMADLSSSRVQASNKLQMKTFSFYTLVDLGPIVPREETRTSLDDF